jgi:hypothetical protein
VRSSLHPSILALAVFGTFGLSARPGSFELRAQAASTSFTTADSSDGLYISPELGITPTRSIDSALGEPFRHAYKVTVGKPPELVSKTLHNCLDYLPVEESIYSAGSALDEHSLRAQGARCDAYDLLRLAKASANPSFSDFSFAHLSVKALPPGLALIISDDERMKASAIAARDGSILELERAATLRATGPNTAELTTKDWTATLTVYAHGDFLSDGNEELLLRRDAYAIHGSYRSISVFLLARGKSGIRIVRQRP